jgi:hypothetical protein
MLRRGTRRRRRRRRRRMDRMVIWIRRMKVGRLIWSLRARIIERLLTIL